MDIIKMTGGKIFRKIYGLPLVIITIAIIFALYVWFFVKGRGFMTIPLLPILVIPIVLMTWLITYSKWTWAIGSQLYNHLPKKLSVHFSTFKAVTLITLLTPIFGLVLFFSKGVMGIFLDEYGNLMNSVIYVIIVILMCIMIQHWLLAKFFRSIELQKNASPAHFFNYFLILIMHPIGIIPFQNRIKRHFEKQ